MKSISMYLNFDKIVHNSEIKPTIILLLAAILPAVQKYFGSINFYLTKFPAGDSAQASYYMFLTTFGLLGIIPLLIVLYIFRNNLADFGLRLGDWKAGLAFTSILFLIIGVLLLLPSSQTSEMQNFYPLSKGASYSIESFLQFELLRILFFYTAWEFFFRGFMLYGLRPFTGDWLAICIQTIPSCLWHIGMPTGEIFASIAGGILFGILAIRTGSILWPWILHCLIGITLDLFIIVI